jgi:cation transport ATPase
MSVITASRPTSEVPKGAAVVLAVIVLGLWAALTPYAAAATGYGVTVDPTLEIIDHVVPGGVIVAVNAALLWRARRPGVGDLALYAAGVTLLAGLWITVTHVPLLAQARSGGVGWGAAVFHSHAGVLVLLVAVGQLAGAMRGAGPVDRSEVVQP